MEEDDDARTPIWLEGPGNIFKIHLQREELGLNDVAHEVSTSVARVMADDPDPVVRERGRGILWVHASLGAPEACEALFRIVRRHVDEVELASEEEERLLFVCTSWRTLAGMSVEATLAASPILRRSQQAAAARSSARAGVRPRRFLPQAGEVVSDVGEREDGLNFQTRKVVGGRSTGNGGAVIVASVGDPDTNDGRNIAARYGDFIGRELPFSGTTPELGRIASVIAAEFPWADNVARDLERRIAISEAVGGVRQTFRPLLLLGPSGSGKTSLAVRLAELFGRKLTVIAAGGSSDSAGLGAVTRGWSGARPSGPFLAAVANGCCDPAILVDEIDKSPRADAQNGSVSGTLHGMLNFGVPFQDSCLMAGVDMSHMMFMATANSLDRLPGSLLDRFDVVVVKRPEVEHFPIVMQTMRRLVAAENGTTAQLVPALDLQETDALLDFFRQGRCSLRTFEKAYKVMLSEAASRERAMPN